jgi:hypothetical protein
VKLFRRRECATFKASRDVTPRRKGTDLTLKELSVCSLRKLKCAGLQMHTMGLLILHQVDVVSGQSGKSRNFSIPKELLASVRGK